MTVFLTPDGEPFYFGTYFPPAPAARHALLPAGARGRRGRLARPARRGRRGRRRGSCGTWPGARSPYGGGGPPGRGGAGARRCSALTREYDAAARRVRRGARSSRRRWSLEFLLRHHARTGSEGALQMARGHLRGDGPRRDLRPARRRLRPLLRGPRRGSCRTSRRCSTTTRCSAASTPTCGGPPAPTWPAGSPWRPPTSWCANCAPHEGGFASALDADSDGPAAAGHVEGAYYVWTPAQLARGPRRGGRGAGRRVLRGHRGGHLRAGRLGAATPAARTGRSDAERVAVGTRSGCSPRGTSGPRPGRDDKVVAAWNGLAIAALAETGAYFDRPDLVEAAVARRRPAGAGAHGRARPAGPYLAGRRGRAPTRACWRTTPTSPRASSRSASVTGEGVWLDFAGLLLDPVLHALHRRGRHALRHRRRRRDADPPAAGPDRQRDPSGLDAPRPARCCRTPRTPVPTRHRDGRGAGAGRRRRARRRGRRGSSAGGWPSPRRCSTGRARSPWSDRRATPATAALHRTALLGTAPGRGGRGGRAAARDGVRRCSRTARCCDGRPAAYVCRHFVCEAPTADPQALAEQLGAR